MADLLSAREIVDKIDRVGNRDGVATLEDIQPHLDAGQKIPLNTADDFHLALQSLNRICGQPADTFQISSILRCPVVEDGKINPNKLKNLEDAFVRTQFDRAFNNKNSDDILRARYQEFLFFIDKNHVPPSELFNVLMNINYFTESLDTILLKDIFFSDDQKTALFQLCLYAAVWHLKYNVKAFAPEELKKYPDWFRKKVAGFEEDILNRLEHWKSVALLGRKEAPKMGYVIDLDSIVTPTSQPFPPMLHDLLGITWHELFHLYRSHHMIAEATWIGERDANLVQAIALLKSENITDPNDKRLKEIIRNEVEKNQGPVANEEDQKGREILFSEQLAINQYALSLSQGQRGKQMEPLEKIVERAHVIHVFNNFAGFTFLKYPVIYLSTLQAFSKQYLLDRANEYRQERRKEMVLLEENSYAWPPESKEGKKILFFEMLERMNSLLEKNQDRLTKDILNLCQVYRDDIEQYIQLLIAREYYDIIIEKNSKGKKSWWFINNYDFKKSSDFIQKYKWIFWIPGAT